MPLYPRGGGNSFKKSANLEVFSISSPKGQKIAQLLMNDLMSFFFKVIISLGSSVS